MVKWGAWLGSVGVFRAAVASRAGWCMSECVPAAAGCRAWPAQTWRASRRARSAAAAQRRSRTWTARRQSPRPARGQDARHSTRGSARRPCQAASPRRNAKRRAQRARGTHLVDRADGDEAAGRVRQPLEQVRAQALPRRQRKGGEDARADEHLQRAQPKGVLGQRLRRATAHAAPHRRVGGDALPFLRRAPHMHGWRRLHVLRRMPALSVVGEARHRTPSAPLGDRVVAAPTQPRRTLRRSSESSRPISKSRKSTPSSDSASMSLGSRMSLQRAVPTEQALFRRLPVHVDAHVASAGTLSHPLVSVPRLQTRCGCAVLLLRPACCWPAHPSWWSTTPVTRKPRTGDTLTRLHSGTITTVLLRKTSKSAKEGGRASLQLRKTSLQTWLHRGHADHCEAVEQEQSAPHGAPSEASVAPRGDPDCTSALSRIAVLLLRCGEGALAGLSGGGAPPVRVLTEAQRQQAGRCRVGDRERPPVVAPLLPSPGLRCCKTVRRPPPHGDEGRCRKAPPSSCSGCRSSSPPAACCCCCCWGARLQWCCARMGARGASPRSPLHRCPGWGARAPVQVLLVVTATTPLPRLRSPVSTMACSSTPTLQEAARGVERLGEQGQCVCLQALSASGSACLCGVRVCGVGGCHAQGWPPRLRTRQGNQKAACSSICGLSCRWHTCGRTAVPRSDGVDARP